MKFSVVLNKRNSVCSFRLIKRAETIFRGQFPPPQWERINQSGSILAQLGAIFISLGTQALKVTISLDQMRNLAVGHGRTHSTQHATPPLI